MSATRNGRVRKATTIVPLALLSAAWTASLTGLGPAATTVAATTTTPEEGTLPSGATVPSRAIEAPASVSAPEEVSPGFEGTEAEIEQIVSTSSTNGIPAAALSAYQRAEAVINSADKSCNLSWQLIAAIGRVESDHGRYAGNALNAQGIATPGIYGIALNGKNNTAVIRDTDAGQYDNDTTYDRAVGPMQFIPSTWSVVGVDADSDGVRNPQDIDDASLATAVYLCSGTDDLSTLSGQRTSVYRYNHSDSYVNLVLSVADNYLSGDFTSVPNGTTAAGFLTPLPGFTVNGPAETGPTTQPAPDADPAPQVDGPDASDDPATEPTPAPTPAPNGNGGDKGNGPKLPGGLGDVQDTVEDVVDGVGDVVDEVTGPVAEALTRAEALVQCAIDGVPALDVAGLAECVEDYMNPGKK